MSFKALVYAYIFGGLTFIPLVLAGLLFFTIYTSVPVGDVDPNKDVKAELEKKPAIEQESDSETPDEPSAASLDLNDIPRTRRGWLTMRRTFEESAFDGSYVTLVRSFLDARSKDPKRSRPKDMWYVVLKGKVLYLYEDEGMTECEAAVELSGHDVIVYPEGQLDGELFAKRNAICLRPKVPPPDDSMPSVTKEMKLSTLDVEEQVEESGRSAKHKEKERERLLDAEKRRDEARQEASDVNTPWFIFVRSNVEMEDWYFALIHASERPAHTSTLAPLSAVFQPADMNHLVTTLDEQPDVIPMRWLNALIGRIFFSYYRTHALEANIIARLMKKLSKVKRPNFLTDVVVKEVSVGNRPPTLSKPMLKELTKEGDAALEVHLLFKGEIRITVEATAVINLGSFKSYTVKIVLAAVLKELEGNLLIKVKRPPSSRIWYAFTQTPRMVLAVEPIVSDRQITWTMILSTIESRLKEIIQESVVMPNMDDIAFFESSMYSRRGGIWEDASRHERHESSPAEASDADASPAPDLPSTASAPDLSTNTVPPSIEISASSPAQSAPSEAVPLTRDVSPQPPEVASVRSMPTNMPSGEQADSSNSSINSARNWFSSLRGGDALASALSQSGGSEHLTDDEDNRGRTQEVTKNAVLTSQAHRSHSTPNAHTMDGLPNYDEDEAADDTQQRRLSAGASLRTHSGSTSGHGHAASTGSDDFQSGSLSDGSGLSRSSSRNGDRASRQAPPASPTGFLSTLKSRAEKQVLSNTAKEAMRKWSANWSGFRRDASNGSSNGHKASGSMSGTEDIPDHSSISGQDGSLAKSRLTYAEVRAAVAERREREQASSSSDTQLESEPKRGTSPVNIPDAGKGRARVISAGAALAPQSSGADSSSALSRSPQMATSWSGESSKQTSRPITPQRIESKGSDSSGNKDALALAKDADEVPEERPSMPIYRQPQAKTMAIPGIHASHRGDVMSMGYVAPTPPPSTSAGSDTRSETGSGSAPSIMAGKLKQNPAVQSMYRFWKSPVSTNMAGAPFSPTPPTVSQSAAQTGDNEASGDSTSTGDAWAAPPPVQPPVPGARPTPPPLPPRSTPVPRPPSSSAATTAVSGSPESVRSLSSTPSASEALKSIAVKDGSIRAKRVSLGLEQSPSQSPSQSQPQSQSQLQSSQPPSPSPSPSRGGRELPGEEGERDDGAIRDAGLEDGEGVHGADGEAERAAEMAPSTPPRVPRPGPPLPPRRVQAAPA